MGHASPNAWMSRAAWFLVGLLAAAALVWGLTRELSRAWFLPGLQPEVVAELEQALADQRELARLSPQTARERHAKFDRSQALLGRLRVLALSREDLVSRHRSVLLGAVLAAVLLVGGVYVHRQARQERRLGRLHSALAELARGVPDVRVGEAGADLISRVARMTEEVSRAYSRDRRRLASLEDLGRWQEAARRHAHEMRTPLASARLDLDRLRALVATHEDPGASLAGLAGDLEAAFRRLEEFSRAFAAFGRLPEPRPERTDLASFLREFGQRFAPAWPDARLEVTTPEAPCPASCDRDLLRQVLVNLCDNAAGALREAGRRGCIRMSLTPAIGSWAIDVADDGPGLAAEALPLLFHPYATFRQGGTGLGLAVARKILLDHGGDLELVRTSAEGASFRLTLPAGGEA